MRPLILASLVLLGVGALVACGRRGGRHFVIVPDEVAGRKGDQWHVTQEPSESAPALERGDPGTGGAPVDEAPR